MTHDRDVAAFDRRAEHYDEGRRGELHRAMAQQCVTAALAACPTPSTVLDVGCGTGAALHELARRLPDAREVIGVDPAPRMVAVARSRVSDHRVRVARGAAEALPIATGTVDLLVTVTSFDHWADQAAGLRECARVLRADGVLVCSDLFSLALVPTLLVGRQGRVRTVRAASHLLRAAGFEQVAWGRGVLIKTVVARGPKLTTSRREGTP